MRRRRPPSAPPLRAAGGRATARATNAAATPTASIAGAAGRGAPDLPAWRPSRVVVEPVRPIVDGGTFPAKASIGQPVTVLADVFTDGHDLVEAALLVRPAGAGDAAWNEIAMVPLGNDRHRASFVPDQLGPWEYDVIGWMAHAETWRQGMVKKLAAGQDVAVDMEIGRRRVVAVVESPAAGARDVDLDRLRALAEDLGRGDPSTLDDDSWRAVFHRCEPREPVARLDRPLRIDVDPLIASVGAWYSFFPRSTASSSNDHGGQDSADHDPPPPGTLRDAIDRLDYIASLGFDVAYIPPVHPIGITNRKGKNNATVAQPDDVGSPYAIGSPDGGHLAVAPELGTLDDFRELVAVCRERGMYLALDIAFNCSPDHPWVTEHPEWFTRRPGQHDPVRREPAEEVRGHLPARLRDRGLAGPVGRARRRVRVLDRAAASRCSASTTRTPRRSPSGSGCSPTSAQRTPDVIFLVGGVHPAADHAATREGRVQPVVHVLHLAPLELGSAHLLHGPRDPGRSTTSVPQPGPTPTTS